MSGTEGTACGAISKGAIMFSKESFGRRLLEIRSKSGETQEQIGAVLGVGKTQISQIENGLATTSIERLYKICEHYHVSPAYFMGLTDDPAPHNWKTDADAP